VIAAIGIIAALGLSACGDDPAEPGAAAVSGDQRVSVRELQDAYTELNAVAKGPGGPPIPQTALLSWLLLGPIAVPAAAQAGAAVSDAEASRLLDELHAQKKATEAAAASPSPTPSEGEPTPSPTATPSPTVVPGTYSASTIAAVRSYLSMQGVIQQLNEADAIRAWMTKLYDQLDARDPQVSPRYGAYARPDLETAASLDDLLTVVGTPTPNWFSAVATPTPSPEAGIEGEQAPPPAESAPSATPTPTP
jgi:hypothetical protein